MIKQPVVLTVRVSRDERDAIARVAAVLGQSVSELIRASLLRHPAVRIVAPEPISVHIGAAVEL